ncbi:hypothetical protein MASR1M97_00740 [Candidatus Desulfobacillus denitrificans]
MAMMMVSQGSMELRTLDGDGLAAPAGAPAAEAVLHELDAGEAVAVGGQPDRGAQALDAHAFALGLEDLLLRHRDVFLGGADVDGHLLRAEPRRDARAIQRGEAGADHGDALADDLLHAAVHLHEEIQAVLDALHAAQLALLPLALQGQRRSGHAAGGEQHGVELLLQLRHRDLSLAVADLGAGAHLHAEAQGVVQLDVEGVARQAELGNAVAQHAARALLALEDHHVVAEQREVVRRGDAGRPGADDGDALAGGRIQALGDAVAGVLHVGGDALQVADRHRLAVAGPAVAALVLAGPRADAAEDAGQDVGFAVGFVGAAILALDDFPDVDRDVGARRTGRLAGHVLPDPADVARVVGEVFALRCRRSSGLAGRRFDLAHSILHRCRGAKACRHERSSRHSRA